MRHLTRILLLAPLLALLTSCAGTLRSDVVTFHEGVMPYGETIRVEAVDTALSGSLEFQHYADMIRKELGRLGYTPVPAGEPTQLVARVAYSVSEGQTEIRSYPNNNGFARYQFWYGHYHTPYYYGFSTDWEPEIYSYTVFNRKLEIDIQQATDGKVLFEGRVQSLGREREIAKVMPYLVTAMFTNYPGESGVTKVVTLEKKP